MVRRLGVFADAAVPMGGDQDSPVAGLEGCETGSRAVAPIAAVAEGMR